MKDETEVNVNKANIQQKGLPLNEAEIKSQIVGKTFLGSHPPIFKYIIAINLVLVN